MENAVALEPDYLTVLTGGNDLCADTVAEMTSVADFQTQLETAMTTLAAGSPNTHVYVVSIPDACQLWNLFKGNFWARFIWAAGNICQSLLANPTSTQQVDVQRRAAVRQRNIDCNLALATVCSTFTSCRFDNNAVFNTQFTATGVSGDYFHPSVAGQARLASGSWSVGTHGRHRRRIWRQPRHSRVVAPGSAAPSPMGRPILTARSLLAVGRLGTAPSRRPRTHRTRTLLPEPIPSG